MTIQELIEALRVKNVEWVGKTTRKAPLQALVSQLGNFQALNEAEACHLRDLVLKGTLGLPVSNLVSLSAFIGLVVTSDDLVRPDALQLHLMTILSQNKPKYGVGSTVRLSSSVVKPIDALGGGKGALVTLEHKFTVIALHESFKGYVAKVQTEIDGQKVNFESLASNFKPILTLDKVLGFSHNEVSQLRVSQLLDCLDTLGCAADPLITSGALVSLVVGKIKELNASPGRNLVLDFENCTHAYNCYTDRTVALSNNMWTTDRELHVPHNMTFYPFVRSMIHERGFYEASIRYGNPDGVYLCCDLDANPNPYQFQVGDTVTLKPWVTKVHIPKLCDLYYGHGVVAKVMANSESLVTLEFTHPQFKKDYQLQVESWKVNLHTIFKVAEFEVGQVVTLKPGRGPYDIVDDAMWAEGQKAEVLSVKDDKATLCFRITGGFSLYQLTVSMGDIQVFEPPTYTIGSVLDHLMALPEPFRESELRRMPICPDLRTQVLSMAKVIGIIGYAPLCIDPNFGEYYLGGSQVQSN